MAVFLDTRGNPTLGIGICGRCSRKFALHELQPDPNYPGLYVCRVDRDDFDPELLDLFQDGDEVWAVPAALFVQGLY